MSGRTRKQKTAAQPQVVVEAPKANGTILKHDESENAGSSDSVYVKENIFLFWPNIIGTALLFLSCYTLCSQFILGEDD
jgi:hypothetical protein